MNAETFVLILVGIIVAIIFMAWYMAWQIGFIERGIERDMASKGCEPVVYGDQISGHKVTWRCPPQAQT